MSRLEFSDLELANGAKVDGTVSSGEFLVILGRNGTGKSLLLKTIMGLIPRKSGTILLDGVPVIEATAARRRFGKGGVFAYVPQRFNAGFPLTVRETVALGRARGMFGFPGTGTGDSGGRNSISKDVEAILQKLGILHLRNSYTDKISGGELALVSLARALMQDGVFLVLDEPEANLDVSKKAEFYQLIRGILKCHEFFIAERSSQKQRKHSCEQVNNNREQLVDIFEKTVNKSIDNSVDNNSRKSVERFVDSEADVSPGILFVTHDPLFALNLKGCSGHIGAFLRNGEFREFSAEELTSRVLEDIYATPAEIRESLSGIRYPVFSDLLGSFS
ncbi:ABC transporter ATP-binding protein [Succinimonas amylolytica]|uniref:ABC transporter ATP-binding protein n=1 Tax=Succinimonas amylolytica TaxID=83769 RepID=UPI0023A791D6